MIKYSISTVKTKKGEFGVFLQNFQNPSQINYYSTESHSTNYTHANLRGGRTRE
jgi:hypothetical protein